MEEHLFHISFASMLPQNRHITSARTIRELTFFGPINTVIKPGEGMFNGKKVFVRCYLFQTCSLLGSG